MSYQVGMSKNPYSEDHSGESSETEDCTKQYFPSNKSYSRYHGKYINPLNNPMRDGQWGICNRVDNLLTESTAPYRARGAYSVGQLPPHESEEKYVREDTQHMGSELDNFNVPGNEKREKKIKQLRPFFTMVNCDQSGDTQYKEMRVNSKSNKKIVSLVALDKKIKRRNSLMNQFGKVHITNLS